MCSFLWLVPKKGMRSRDTCSGDQGLDQKEIIESTILYCALHATLSKAFKNMFGVIGRRCSLCLEHAYSLSFFRLSHSRLWSELPSRQSPKMWWPAAAFFPKTLSMTDLNFDVCEAEQMLWAKIFNLKNFSNMFVAVTSSFHMAYVLCSVGLQKYVL